MSHTIANAVMRDCCLKGERRTLMLCLAFHADDDGLCWPSQKLLAAETNCSRRGVQKMLAGLAAAGELEVLKEGNGRQNPAHYRLTKYCEKGEPIVRPLEAKERTHGAPFIEPERANVATGKGERGNTKGERSDVKGERPQRKMYPNTNRTPKEDKNTSNGTEIPADLQTPEFLEAWKRFKTHRTQIRKPIRAMGEEMQLRALLEMGPDRAAAAIDHSIRQGWQGIFEPSARKGNPPPHTGPVDFSQGF